MSLDHEAAKEFFSTIKTKWLILHNTPKIFSYKLNIHKSRILVNNLQRNFSFYAELNIERSTLRRTPQSIHSLTPTFDPSKFNFNKINAQEIIATIPWKNDDCQEVSIIINNSPLTVFHSLICPDITKNLPQRLTLGSLSFCVHFLQQLSDKPAIRIGYNSPGALASVNHLHLHLLHLNVTLYIDKVELKPLKGNYVYCLMPEMPTEGICFIFRKTDNTSVIKERVDELFQFCNWLCVKNIPHNLFMTHDKSKEKSDHGILKVFVFARAYHCNEKIPSTCNIGFCELSGFVPIGDETLFESITAHDVITKINTDTGNIYKIIYNYFAAIKQK